jgi:hypothetical protein
MGKVSNYSIRFVLRVPLIRSPVTCGPTSSGIYMNELLE